VPGVVRLCLLLRLLYLLCSSRRGGGFFTLITQFQGRQCLVTYLENYKKDPAAAEPYITFTLFDELVARKGVALLRGEVTNQLTRDEGQRFVVHHRFYAAEQTCTCLPATPRLTVERVFPCLGTRGVAF
jgi:hypothetical protein